MPVHAARKLETFGDQSLHGGEVALEPLLQLRVIQKVGAQSHSRDRTLEIVRNCRENARAFGQMIGKLFDQSGPDVRAGLLQHLLGGLGPPAAGAVGGTALGGLLRDALGRGIAPSDTEQVSRDDVEKAANAAAAHNPGIIDQVAAPR